MTQICPARVPIARFMEATRESSGDSLSDLRNRGPMQFSWVLDTRFQEHTTVSIEAVDIFGLTWQICCTQSADDDQAENIEQSSGLEDEEARKTEVVLYRWNDGYGSLFPPKYGWYHVQGTEGGRHSLSYSLSDTRY